jgi:hypothetical protein
VNRDSQEATGHLPGMSHDDVMCHGLLQLRERGRSTAAVADWCSTSGWIHTPEPIEMHNRFPFVLQLGYLPTYTSMLGPEHAPSATLLATAAVLWMHDVCCPSPPCYPYEALVTKACLLHTAHAV